MRFLIVLVLIGLMGWFQLGGSIGAASGAAEKDLVEKVDARYADIQDLQADFIQETVIEGFSTGLKSSGRLYLKKPGLLRWDYLEPSEERIYVTGDQVMMYVPEHQQVMVGALTHMAASKGPLALLQGVGKLSQQFTVVEAEDGSKDRNGHPQLTLIPKPAGQETPTIHKIVLRLFPDTYLIKSITLYEASGNVSRVLFEDIQVNSDLSSRLFKFEVPPGVVVVEMPS